MMTELGKQVWKKMEEMGWKNAPAGFHLEYYENIIECTKQVLTIHDVMLCTFCEKEIIDTELTYTEDAEPSHIKCLKDFNKHWEDRTKMMDLMGY